MKTGKLLGISIILGVVITGITGLVNTTPGGLIGATWYGWPEAWAVQLSGAYGAPWTFNYVSLVVDIIVWLVIAFVVLFAAMRVMKKK